MILCPLPIAELAKAEGYTLRRAFHEVGGDRRLLHELDLQHGKPETDMSPSGKAYPLLLRLALNGMCKAWIAGPPCRTRSVLRHFAIPGQDMPRPLRAWHGEEHGLHDLKPYEKEQVFTDGRPDDEVLAAICHLRRSAESSRRRGSNSPLFGTAC